MEGTARQLIDHLLEFVHDPEARFELKRKRKSRSLTQNAYYWAMLNQLAPVVGLSGEELHKRMLADYGVTHLAMLRADVPPEECFFYWDFHNEGTVKGEAFKQYKVYKRSRDMDSAEFSRLVDGMRRECEEQGIPVRTPEEIARMEFVEPARG